MKKYRFLYLFMGLVLLLMAASLASAQTTGQPPAIVSFIATPRNVSLTEVEAGTATITLSWRVINLAEAQQLSIDVLKSNEWETLFDQTTILLPVDSRQLTVPRPLTFRSPTYRLVLRDSKDGRLLDQMVLVVPYAVSCVDGCVPAITDFRIPTPSVDADSLRLRTAIIPVAWAIANRPATANPVFEQLLDNGSTAIIELPRESLWIPSSGEGVVAPMATQNDTVQIRMRLVDLVTDEVYDERIVSVPVSSADRPPIMPSDVPATDTTPKSEAQILMFNATPNPADPNGTITLNWEVTSADSVRISWLNPGLNTVNNDELPLSGSITVAMPGVRSRSGLATFDLWVMNASGDYAERNAGGAVTARVEVRMMTDLTINSFTISPNPVAPNGTVSLSWDVSNAAAVSITRLSPAGIFQASSIVENLPAAGSVELTVPEEYVSAVTYYLGVTDANGIVKGQYATAQISE